MSGKAGNKKKDGQRKRVQQKEVMWVSGEGLAGGKMVKDNKIREKEKKDDRRQIMQHKRGKRLNGEGLPGGKTVEVDDRREKGAKIEDVAEKAVQVMGGGTGGSFLVHEGTNIAEKEGTNGNRWRMLGVMVIIFYF